jgi:CheY-like chemotaxis protein
VVDDDPIYQIIINKIIKKSELFSTVFTFKNGKEALDTFKQSLAKNENIPNIILLDLNMPVMDGWEFMDEMKCLNINNKTTYIYIVSSSIAVEDKLKSKTYPIILGYLSKPINANDLEIIATND